MASLHWCQQPAPPAPAPLIREPPSLALCLALQDTVGQSTWLQTQMTHYEGVTGLTEAYPGHFEAATGGHVKAEHVGGTAGAAATSPALSLRLAAFPWRSLLCSHHIASLRRVYLSLYCNVYRLVTSCTCSSPMNSSTRMCAAPPRSCRCPTWASPCPSSS